VASACRFASTPAHGTFLWDLINPHSVSKDELLFTPRQDVESRADGSPLDVSGCQAASQLPPKCSSVATLLAHERVSLTPCRQP